jgi:hypothetical protein
MNVRGLCDLEPILVVQRSKTPAAKLKIKVQGDIAGVYRKRSVG